MLLSKHNAVTVSLHVGYNDTFVCACFSNKRFMATSVTHMGRKGNKSLVDMHRRGCP